MKVPRRRRAPGIAARAESEVYVDARTGRLHVAHPDGQVFDLETLAHLGVTKGDLLVYDGSRWRFMPAGASGEVLTVDPTAPMGVAWAPTGSGAGGAADSVPVPDTRRVVFWTADHRTNNLEGAGGPNLPTEGLFDSHVIAADGAFLRRRSSTTAGYKGGWKWQGSATQLATRRDWAPEFRCRFRTGPSNAGVTYWVGLWRIDLLPTQAAAQTTYHLALRAADGTDTNWQLSGADGTSQAVVDTGVPVAADTTYRLRLKLDSSGAQAWLDGTALSVPSVLPGTSDALGFVVLAYTQGGVAAKIACASVYLETE